MEDVRWLSIASAITNMIDITWRRRLIDGGWRHDFARAWRATAILAAVDAAVSGNDVAVIIIFRLLLLLRLQVFHLDGWLLSYAVQLIQEGI